MFDDEQPRYPEQPKPSGRGRGPLGGVLVMLAVAAAKFKALLAVALSFKWIFLGSKLLLSFGSMFLSIWLYAVLFGGVKIAVVFVLMILVHELGHFLTWRNYGIPARLPLFLPGFGAVTIAPGAGGTPAQNTAASIAGPIFGVGAAAVCWAYGAATGEAFWYAAAYIGFFLNFFNLMPVPMLDGGAIAAAIDARLWFLGLPLFVLWMIFVAHFSGFSIIFTALIAFYAIPRMIAVWNGQIDPRSSGLTTPQRILTAVAYFGLALIAIAGALQTSHDAVVRHAALQ